MKRIAILGGGITGLAAAFELEKLTDAQIDLYEASDHFGGKVRTLRTFDLTIETGPDCFFARKAGVSELVAELGLEDQLIEPKQKSFQMLVGGKLHAVPPGLVTLTSACSDAIEEAEFLSPEVKARALAEPDQPKGSLPDESIQAFFSRRFGAEFSRLVVEPLLAGTHGGNAASLSMRAVYPAYWNQEQRLGHLSGTTPVGSGGSAFKSFKNGMATLVEELARQLDRTEIHLNQTPRIQDLDADAVLVAIPANHASAVIEAKAPSAAQAMREIPHASSAIVTLVFDRNAVGHPLDSTGFLVPEGEMELVTGATFSSEKWPNRAPKDTVLMRIFLGGDRAQLPNKTEKELTEAALSAITPLLQITGQPKRTWVDKWIEALPQYDLHHLARVAKIEEALSAVPGLFVAGTSYGGVGLPDSARQAKEIAARIAQTL